MTQKELTARHGNSRAMTKIDWTALVFQSHSISMFLCYGALQWTHCAVLYCTAPLCYYTRPHKVTSESSIIPAAYAAAAGGETEKAGVTVEVTISFKGSQSVSPNDGFYFLFGAALRI